MICHPAVFRFPRNMPSIADDIVGADGGLSRDPASRTLRQARTAPTKAKTVRLEIQQRPPLCFFAEMFTSLAYGEIQQPGAALQRDLPPAGGIERAPEFSDRPDARPVDLADHIALLEAKALGGRTIGDRDHDDT